MAISLAQTIQFNDTDNTTHQKTGVTTTAGNRLILAIASKIGTVDVSGIADSAGNTWTKVVEADDAVSSTASIWSTSNAAAAISAGSYTITNAGSGAPIQSTFFEAVNTDVIDVTHTGTGSSTSISSGATAAPFGSGELMIGVLSNGLIFADNTYSSVTFTDGVDHTQARTTRTANFLQGATADRILVGSAAQTFSATAANSAAWAAAVAIWKVFVPPGPSTFQNYQSLKAPSAGSSMWITEHLR